jgi:hypothetical protein
VGKIIKKIVSYSKIATLMSLCALTGIIIATLFFFAKGSLVSEIVCRYWVATRGVIFPIWGILCFPIGKEEREQKEFLIKHIKYALAWELVYLLPTLWEATVGSGYKEEKEKEAEEASLYGD